jgi:hypothetical protein
MMANGSRVEFGMNDIGSDQEGDAARSCPIFITFAVEDPKIEAASSDRSETGNVAEFLYRR